MNGMLRTTVKMRCATVLGVVTALSVGGHTPASAEEGIPNAGVSHTSLYNDYINGIGASGWRPTRLNGYREGSYVRYATRWVKNTDDREWAARPSQSVSTFNTEITYRKNNNWRPIDVSGFNNPSGDVRFNSLWERAPAGLIWNIYKDQTLTQMTALAGNIGQLGWKPRKIEGYILNGDARYVSIWEYDPSGPLQVWHSKMTPGDYQNKFDTYAGQGYKVVSLDSYTYNGDVYMAAVWRKTSRSQYVRSNRAAVPFQRYSNNYWAKGYNFDIIYGVDTPGGTRYGGIWVYDAARPTTTLGDQLKKAVNNAPALGGAYVYNETTGDSAGVHPDQVFAIASSAKIGILYAVLRDIDLGKYSWNSLINSGSTMGQNNGSLISTNTNYTVKQLAEWMIAYSNNWATNLLIKKVGRTTINGYLDAQGLDYTRINRYMVGTGAPSSHGWSSSYEDRLHGWENTSTPREMVTLLRRIYSNNILSNTGEDRFWATMNLDSNGGTNTKGYCGSVAGLYNPAIVLFNKAGNNDDLRAHRAEGGRMAFPDGQQVFYMFCMDYVSDSPDDTSASATALTNANNAIKNSGIFTAQRFY